MSIKPAELSVSNICWNGTWGSPDDPNSHVAAETLQTQNPPVRNIDIAPTKIFDAITRFGADSVTADEIQSFQTELNRHDLTVRGFQSLTYQRSENIFRSREDRGGLQKHLAGIIRLGGRLGIQTLIYGSPPTRIHEGLSEDERFEQAAELFTGLDEVATTAGVVLGIEPVSTTWTNGRPVFGQSGNSVVNFVDRLQGEHGTQSIKFVPDTFAMYSAGEIDPESVMAAATTANVLAPHMQIAEPGLAPHTLESPIDHKSYGTAFSRALGYLSIAYPDFTPTIAIEMQPEAGYRGPSDTINPLRNAMTAAQHNYQSALMI